MRMKKKVLCWLDSPTCATGFGQVANNILRRLQATDLYDFDIIGINHAGDPYDTAQYPFRIFPAVAPLSADERMRSDIYGFQKFLLFAGTGRYDIVFILNDTFVINTIMKQLLETQLKLPKDRKFEIITYFPVDSPLKKEWVTNVVSPIAFPVTYTNYAFKECLKHDPDLDSKLRVIYHGVDKAVFHPMEKTDALRKEILGPEHCGKFVVLNVNRNQPRKDLPRTFAGFKIFHDKYPNTLLFILAQAQDVGGDLMEIASRYGLVWDKDWVCPAPGSYGANQGYPVSVVNKIYNTANVVVSSTLGEGWGLSISEAFATLKPAIFPDNTSLHEIIGENSERGWFIKSGEDLDHFVCLGSPDNNQVRPMINVFSLADQLEYVYTHPEESRAKAERAFNEVWVWDDLCIAWKDVFARASKKVDVVHSDVKVGRNDPCPCGSGEKWKHCCGAVYTGSDAGEIKKIVD